MVSSKSRRLSSRYAAWFLLASLGLALAVPPVAHAVDSTKSFKAYQKHLKKAQKKTQKQQEKAQKRLQKLQHTSH